MMQPQKILVTGGAGFIGSHTVNVLCDLGHDVRVIDDLSFGFEKFVDSRATFFKASIADETILAQALEGVDVVMHFAAASIIKYSLENPLLYIENNIVNGTKLLEGMRKAGVKKIIFSSSASVYGEPTAVPIPEDAAKNPLQPYGASKLAFENILSAYYHSFGIESISLRYFNAYGPRDDQTPASRAVPMWIKEVLGGKEVRIYWNAAQLRDYVFVKDIAKAHAKALEVSGCTAFNIGSGTGVVMKDILDEIMSIVGKNVSVIDQGKRLGDPMKLTADISAFQKATGWKPETTLHDGLVETIAYYSKESQ